MKQLPMGSSQFSVADISPLLPRIGWLATDYWLLTAAVQWILMFDAFLVPERTIVTAKGDSAPLDVSASTSAVFLVTLSITGVVEQESLEITLFTSPDGTTWDAKPVASCPQRFYVGECPLLVDLSAATSAKFLRAHWEVSRWGRGPTGAKFEFGLRIREVSREALLEAQAEAQARR